MPVLVCPTELNNQKKYTISPKKNISLSRWNKNRDWSASLTVEASFVLPMFFFLIFWLWQIFLLRCEKGCVIIGQIMSWTSFVQDFYMD